MDEITLRCNAHHEAAHAVVFLTLNVDVDRIGIWEAHGDRRAGGLCLDDPNPDRKYETAVASLAGIESDRYLLENNQEELQNRTCGWENDRNRANQLLEELRIEGHSGYSLQGAEVEAAGLVRHHWERIQKIAEALISRYWSNHRERARGFLGEATHTEAWIHGFEMNALFDQPEPREG